MKKSYIIRHFFIYFKEEFRYFICKYFFILFQSSDIIIGSVKKFTKIKSVINIIKSRKCKKKKEKKEQKVGMAINII